MRIEGVAGRRVLRTLVLPGLVGAAWLAAPAVAEDTRPPTVDALVEALRQDPVVVDQSMGNGDAVGATRLLTAQARATGVPTYVALVTRPLDDPTSDSDPSALITALHRRLDRPGLYVVATTVDSTVTAEAFGVTLDATLVDLAAYTAETKLQKLIDRDDFPPAVAQAELRLLTAPHAGELSERSGGEMPSVVPPAQLQRIADSRFGRQPDLVDSPRYDGGSSADVEDRWFGAGLGFGAVTPLVYLLLRGRWPGWRAPAGRRIPPRVVAAAPPPRLRPAEVRATAERELNRLSGALAGSDPDRSRRELWDLADRSREAAETVHRSEELADQVGAVVLARIGRRSLTRATGRGRSSAYRPCFFDPLHAEGLWRVTWNQGDSELTIPACKECRVVEDGGTPHPLRIGRKAYYERDDVWARTGYGALVDDLADVVLREWHR